jgi:hypothetical protein
VIRLRAAVIMYCSLVYRLCHGVSSMLLSTSTLADGALGGDDPPKFHSAILSQQHGVLRGPYSRIRYWKCDATRESRVEAKENLQATHHADRSSTRTFSAQNDLRLLGSTPMGAACKIDERIYAISSFRKASSQQKSPPPSFQVLIRKY